MDFKVWSEDLCDMLIPSAEFLVWFHDLVTPLAVSASKVDQKSLSFLSVPNLLFIRRENPRFAVYFNAKAELPKKFKTAKGFDLSRMVQLSTKTLSKEEPFEVLLRVSVEEIFFDQRTRQGCIHFRKRSDTDEKKKDCQCSKV